MMRTFLRAGLVGLALVLAAPAAGQDLQKGRAAYLAGDYATALREWRPLAEAGNIVTQYFLGVMFRDGQGAPQNDAEAAKWFRLAAAQGNAQAQSKLGSIYFIGRGVPQAFVQAHMWWNLAAAQGYENSAKLRDMAASEMTPAQIAEAQRLANEWREKHPQ